MQCPLHLGQQAILPNMSNMLYSFSFTMVLQINIRHLETDLQNKIPVFQGSVIAFGRSCERWRQTDTQTKCSTLALFAQ